MLIELNGKRPLIDPSAYIAPTAVIIGDVVIGPEASVWFGAVIRGDSGAIRIGARTNVQDNVVIHVNGRSHTILENDVTVGHGAVLEGCHIHDGCLIGMHATVLSGSVVGAGAFVAAGTLIREGMQVPSEMLVVGVPGEVKRPLTTDLKARLAEAAPAYVNYREMYLKAANVLGE